MLRKQTKSENILVILDFELQTEVSLTKETKDCCASKEKSIVIMVTPIAKYKTYLWKMFRSCDDRLEGTRKI